MVLLSLVPLPPLQLQNEKNMYNELRNKSIQELETKRSTLYDRLAEIEQDPYGGWGSEEWEATYREVGEVELVWKEKRQVAA